MFTSRGLAAVVLLTIAFAFSSLKAGNITGKINFSGRKATSSMIKMNADPKCVKMHGSKDVPSEQTVVNPNKTLEYVFVYVKKGLEGKKFPASTTKLKLDQQGCM